MGGYSIAPQNYSSRLYPLKDVSAKAISTRKARASARLYCSLESLKALEAGLLPKKADPFETARAAAMIAAKRTPEAIPHCHPIPIEAFEIDFKICKEENCVAMEAWGPVPCAHWH